jgi:hypothetical protein
MATTSAAKKQKFTNKPKSRNCSQTGKNAAPSTNCGRKAMKNSAVFGLSSSTTTLSAKTRRVLFIASDGIWPRLRFRIIWMPSQIR